MSIETRGCDWRCRSLLVAACLLVAASAAAGAMLEPGAAFPDWELSDHTGAEVSSRQLAGKSYVLWFYPKAMTPGCTAEGRAFLDRFAEFRERDVEVFGVSFDAPADNARFVESEGFPFRLLSDRDRTLAVAVGAADSKTAPMARRISYLVGPDRKVRAAYADVSPSGHAGEVLGDLAAP